VWEQPRNIWGCQPLASSFKCHQWRRNLNFSPWRGWGFTFVKMWHCLWIRVYRHFERAWRLHLQGLSGPRFFKYQGYPEIKDSNCFGGKEILCCEVGNTVTYRFLPFPFVFAMKETSGRPDFSRRRRGENDVSTSLCAQATGFCDIGIQNVVPRVNKCLQNVVIMSKKTKVM